MYSLSVRSPLVRQTTNNVKIFSKTVGCQPSTLSSTRASSFYRGKERHQSKLTGSGLGCHCRHGMLTFKPQFQRTSSLSIVCSSGNSLRFRNYSTEHTMHEKIKSESESSSPEKQLDSSREFASQSQPFDDSVDYDIPLTDEEMQWITNGDPELIKKVKYIQLEHSVLRQEGFQVPSKIPIKYWPELLPLDSRSKRKKFFLYLFKSEMKESSFQRKKEAKKEERLRMYAENPMPTREEDVYGMYYNLTRNTLFLRLYDTTVTRFQHSQVCSAMLHSPPVIIDCSYDEYMTHREAKNCAKQLELVISDNKAHREPLNLYLCNAGRHTKTMEFLNRVIPTMHEDNYPLNIHEESYMEIFPRDRLVYLTPHTRDDLEEFNDDDIYIIGAMVDRTDPRPYSLAKAKKLNLRMRRLPLDKYLMWGLGGKSLTINQMSRILLDLRYSRGDWDFALKHVPMRKLSRDFHPYPDQVQTNQEGDRQFKAPYRNERKSNVLEDYELLGKRKGFRRSDHHSSAPPPRLTSPKMRSLMRDD